MIGTDIVYIGGEHWNTHAKGKVHTVYLNDGSYEKIDELKYNIWAAAGAYHKNSFFIFGGAGYELPGGALRPNHASDRFYKYTLGQSYPCSKGSYRENAECVLCPRGTYKVDTGDHPCDECPPGTSNPQSGADDSRFCVLCPLGYYNGNSGSPYCY